MLVFRKTHKNIPHTQQQQQQYISYMQRRGGVTMTESSLLTSSVGSRGSEDAALRVTESAMESFRASTWDCMTLIRSSFSSSVA